MKIKMRTKCMTVLFALLLAGSLGLTGCGSTQGTDTPTEITCNAQLYYVNDAAVTSGTGSYMMTDPVTVKLTGMSQDLLMEAVVESLRGVPEDRTGYGTMLTEEMTVNSVKLKDDTATVDFSSDGLSSGSSLQETCLIAQVVESLCKTFDNVKQVQFLVDGKKTDSLMGHVDTTKPFTEDFYNEMVKTDSSTGSTGSTGSTSGTGIH